MMGTQVAVRSLFLFWYINCSTLIMALKPKESVKRKHTTLSISVKLTSSLYGQSDFMDQPSHLLVHWWEVCWCVCVLSLTHSHFCLLYIFTYLHLSEMLIFRENKILLRKLKCILKQFCATLTQILQNITIDPQE